MSFGKVENLISIIFVSLVANVFILNQKDDLEIFDSKSDVGIFLGYSSSSKSYRVYNRRTLVVEESMHIVFDESNPFSSKKVVICDDDDAAPNSQENENSSPLVAPKIPQDELQVLDQSVSILNEIVADLDIGKKPDIGQQLPIIGNDSQGDNSSSLPKDFKFVHNHPKDLILGDPTQGVRTRNSIRNLVSNLAFLSQIEPTTFQEAECDSSWLLAMQEELNQFERNGVWELVLRPLDQSVIGTKWVF